MTATEQQIHEIQARWQREKKEVKAAYKEITARAKTTRGLIHYKILEKQRLALVAKYVDIVRSHVHVYEHHFKAYFKENEHQIISFDIEELHGETSCILGIAIDKNLGIDVFLASSDARPSDKETKALDKKIGSWLKDKEGKPVVLTHGSNPKERQITRQAGHDCENTQDLLACILEKLNDERFQGASIHTFEEFIQFERKGCSFLKHAKEVKAAGIEKKEIAKLFPDQAKLSTWALAAGKAPRTCCLCGREQDVFMYCLEDAFSTTLIYLNARSKGLAGKGA